jgi:hypothetical protein
MGATQSVVGVRGVLYSWSSRPTHANGPLHEAVQHLLYAALHKPLLPCQADTSCVAFLLPPLLCVSLCCCALVLTAGVVVHASLGKHGIVLNL